MSQRVKQFLRDPAIPLPGVYPKERKTYTYTKMCASIFLAALFIIRIVKQPPIRKKRI